MKALDLFATEENIYLRSSLSDMTWRNERNEIVIRCNNNKHSYYEDFVGGTVVMRKDVYDKYIEEHSIKFFAYSEKWTPSTGYVDEVAFHIEIEDRNIIRKYYNYLDNHTEKPEEDRGHCKECPYGFLKKDYGESPLLKFLKDYRVEDVDEL